MNGDPVSPDVKTQPQRGQRNTKGGVRIENAWGSNFSIRVGNRKAGPSSDPTMPKPSAAREPEKNAPQDDEETGEGADEAKSCRPCCECGRRPKRISFRSPRVRLRRCAGRFCDRP